MNFKLNYLIERYTDAFNKLLFIKTQELNAENVLNAKDYNELNNFELQHCMEKEFEKKDYALINFDEVTKQRQEIILSAYVMSHSKLNNLLNEQIVIKPIKIVNFSEVDLVYLQNNALCELIAKDLTNLPPNYLTPRIFFDFVIKLLQELNVSEEIEITAFDNEQIKFNEFNLIDAIASSSNNENFVVKLKYNSNLDQAKQYHIFGKGVCYDSGGYSLKVNNSMQSMKGDMGGASNTFAIFLGNVINNSHSSINAYLGLVQNFVSNPTLLPDQVITTRDGIKVEITNTDSEGRLVIADLISYANSFICEGDEIMVLATLTDIAKSMGRYVNTCFSNNLAYVAQISRAANKQNELIWPLPLNQFDNIYGKELEQASQIATIANSNLANLEANSIYAANFGFYFLKNKANDFVHFDIGSTGWRNKKGHAPLVRTLIEHTNALK